MSEEQKRTALLAEDNVLNQKVAIILLDMFGWEHTLVPDGKQALKAITDGNRYTVILMDCMMPEMDGFEATRQIRRIEKLRGQYTPIIAVTALAMAGDYERCIAAGMDDYISKPISKETLKVKLDHWAQPDVVSRNKKLAHSFNQYSPASSAGSMRTPVNILELEKFYGAGELSNVLELFLSTTENLFAELERAIAERRAQNVSRIAHELKASTTTVGAKDMTKLCLYLEHTTGHEDWYEAEQTAKELTQSFKEMKHFIGSRAAAPQ